MSLTEKNGRITLAVKDNGTGFSLSSARKGGMGLNIMNYRAGAIGASLDIRRKGNHGMRVACMIPRQQSEISKEQKHG